jgi:hypothetical protein
LDWQKHGWQKEDLSPANGPFTPFCRSLEFQGRIDTGMGGQKNGLILGYPKEGRFGTAQVFQQRQTSVDTAVDSTDLEGL